MPEWGCSALTDASLRNMAVLPNPGMLTIRHTRGITSAGTTHLAVLTKLMEIKLAYMPLADGPMLPLSRIESLEYVKCAGSTSPPTGCRNF